MDKADVFIDNDTDWILQDEKRRLVMDFATRHLNEQPAKLMLAYTGKIDHTLLIRAIDQIKSRRNTQRKLPSFLATGDFIFPSTLAAEQATDELVARYNAMTVLSLTPEMKRTVDITAGLGIDAMTLARCSRQKGIDISICCYELDPLKVAALRHNAKDASLDQIEPICIDSLQKLKEDSASDLHYDLLFADPARRSSDSSRVYDPQSCLPDVVGNNHLLRKCANYVAIKHSPMLDISRALTLFPNLHSVHIVCTRGECKEVMTIQTGIRVGSDDNIADDVVISQAKGSDIDFKERVEVKPIIVCVNITSDGSQEVFSVAYDEFITCRKALRYATIENLKEGCYLYHPNAAVMKAGVWGVLQSRHKTLLKVDIDTHLFLSDKLYSDFPGRILRIEKIPDKRQRTLLKGRKINVVTRNYAVDSQTIAVKLKIKGASDRDPDYLYAFRIADKPVMALCRILEAEPH